MDRDGETIPQYLVRARRRDLEKGGDGYRLTSELAEMYGVPSPKMRRHLDKLYEDGLIDCSQEHGGALIYWCAIDEPPHPPA